MSVRFDRPLFSFRTQEISFLSQRKFVRHGPVEARVMRTHLVGRFFDLLALNYGRLCSCRFISLVVSSCLCGRVRFCFFLVVAVFLARCSSFSSSSRSRALVDLLSFLKVFFEGVGIVRVCETDGERFGLGCAVRNVCGDVVDPRPV